MKVSDVAELLGFLLLAAGLTWKFGPFGLIGAGIGLIMVGFLLGGKK